MKKNYPDFFIVGAAKAGTTSLYHYLEQHPQVYMSPIKEPNYFSSDTQLDALRPSAKKRLKALKVDEFLKSDMSHKIHRAYLTDEEQYRSLFRLAGHDKITGEASPAYLFSKVAANAIYQFNPKAKIIIILRNPVERAFSHYLMDRKLAFTSKSFTAALEEDRLHQPKSWGSTSLYLELGLYYEQVKRYFDLFPRSQILIVLSEELRKQPQETLRKLYQFLEINDRFLPSLNEQHNSAVVPRNGLIFKLLTLNTIRVKIRRYLKNGAFKNWLRKIAYTPPEDKRPDEKTIQELKNFYHDDILHLSQLTEKDLSTWL